MANYYTPEQFIMSKRIIKTCFAVFMICFFGLMVYMQLHEPTNHAPAAVQSQAPAPAAPVTAAPGQAVKP